MEKLLRKHQTLKELGNILDHTFGWRQFRLGAHRRYIAPEIRELQEDITRIYIYIYIYEGKEG